MENRWDDMGNYLTPDVAGRDENKISLPYRLASEMQEAIVREASLNDYTFGHADRDDMALDIANNWFNNQVLEPPEIAFAALHYWRRIYGRRTK